MYAFAERAITLDWFLCHLQQIARRTLFIAKCSFSWPIYGAISCQLIFRLPFNKEISILLIILIGVLVLFGTGKRGLTFISCPILILRFCVSSSRRRLTTSDASSLELNVCKFPLGVQTSTTTSHPCIRLNSKAELNRLILFLLKDADLAALLEMYSSLSIARRPIGSVSLKKVRECELKKMGPLALVSFYFMWPLKRLSMVRSFSVIVANWENVPSLI